MNNEKLLANALEVLNPVFEEQIKNRNKWESTNRKLFMRTITKERGDDAEMIIEKMCNQLNIPCILRHDNRAGFDATIKGIQVEIKYASKGQNGGYCFNQIRPDETTYEYVLFFFLDVDDCKFYTARREDLRNFTLNVQHAGKGTYTLTDTKYNMDLFEKRGDGTFENAIEAII